MRGVIVYETDTARERSWYIEKYISTFAKRGIELKLLCFDRRLIDAIGSADPSALKETEHLLKMAGDFKFAIVRVMSPALSAALSGYGITCFNSAEVSRTANDKLRTYEFVRDLGDIPVLEYEALQGASAEAVAEADAGLFPAVLKPRQGHGGEGILYLEDKEALIKAAGNGQIASNGGYVLQRACDEPGVDLRVYVLGGRIRAAMKRMNPGYADETIPPGERFLSNYCLGGRAEVFDIEAGSDIDAYVKHICGALFMDFAGIDFIRHRGRWIFNEIEDVVGARMLYAFTDIDIVEEYAEHMEGCINEQG